MERSPTIAQLTQLNVTRADVQAMIDNPVPVRAFLKRLRLFSAAACISSLGKNRLAAFYSLLGWPNLAKVIAQEEATGRVVWVSGVMLHDLVAVHLPETRPEWFGDELHYRMRATYFPFERESQAMRLWSGVIEFRKYVQPLSIGYVENWLDGFCSADRGDLGLAIAVLLNRLPVFREAGTYIFSDLHTQFDGPYVPVVEFGSPGGSHEPRLDAVSASVESSVGHYYSVRIRERRQLTPPCVASAGA